MASNVSTTLLVRIPEPQWLGDTLLNDYPCLRVITNGESFVLRGSFPVKCLNQEIDSFKVEIALNKDKDLFMPAVKEIGGRIPRIADRHINRDGTACVGLPEDLLLKTRGEPMLLADFLRGPVHDYFFSQVCVESGMGWPNGEWRHGNEGFYDFVTELFESTSRFLIRSKLEFLLADKFRGHWLCCCNSGKKVRSCHKDEIVRMRQDSPIPASVARLLMNRMSGITEEAWQKLAKN